MIKLNSSFIIFIFMILNFTSCNNKDIVNAKDGIVDSVIWICETEAVLLINEYRIFNNVAGKYTGAFYDTNFIQCIAIDTSKNRIGIRWMWDLEKSNDRPFYPEVIYGWNPWETYSTTSKIPEILSAVRSIEVES